MRKKILKYRNLFRSSTTFIFAENYCKILYKTQCCLYYYNRTRSEYVITTHRNCPDLELKVV